jgi:nitrite reductase/ring-hydroxylating ferredoxin subunit
LVFDSGIGIDRSNERLHTADWTAVLPVASLQDGKPQRVEVDGVGVVLCRFSDGRVSAFGEFCPHLAAPMSDGWIDRGSIVCPWHGSRFDIGSGEVVRGPSAAPLPNYQTRITDGMIELRGDGQPATAAPRGVRK